MLCAESVTEKLWLTEGAAAYVVSPACDARIVQVPAETSVTVAPDTVQTDSVVEVKLTTRPEDAGALIVNGGLPWAWFARAPKAIVWLACVTIIEIALLIDEVYAELPP